MKITSQDSNIRLYELQHDIWPGWSEGDNGAHEAMHAVIAAVDLRKGALVLDFGCGVGREIMALGKYGFQSLGIELSLKLTKEANRRIHDAGLSSLCRVEQGDYRIYCPEMLFDLVMFWDSSLNILSRQEVKDVISRCKNFIKPGGHILVSQLAREHFENINKTFKIESPSIGPGRTTRHYFFDKNQDLLIDRVHYKPVDKPGFDLPPQKLVLPSAGDLINTLKNASYTNCRIVGSNQWVWNQDGTTASIKDWRMIMAIGDTKA